MVTVLCANAGLDKTYEVDGLQVGGFHHPRRFRTAPGGKGVNVARVLRALGHDVAITGFAGGTIARYIASYLKRGGITPSFVAIGEESRLCINIIDTRTKTQTRIDEIGPLVTPQEVEELRTRWNQLVQRSAMAIISGSAPRGVPFHLYGELVLAAHSHKVPVIVDAHDELLRHAVPAGPTVVKPNLAELSQLCNRTLSVPTGVLEACSDLHELGIRVVVCSLGAEGAIASAKGQGVYRVRAPKVEVVSPVGAGDAMVAAFAAASIERRPLVERLRWAVAAGTASCTVFGAGFVTRPEVEALTSQVVVEDLGVGSPPEVTTEVP